MHALLNQLSSCLAQVDDLFVDAGIHSRMNCAIAVLEFCAFTRFMAEEIKNGA